MLDIRKKSATEWKIPLYKVLVDKDDVRIVSKVIKRGSYWAIGPEIEEFEEQLANYVGTDYCATFNSGTSAGHAALISCDVKTKNEVIVDKEPILHIDDLTKSNKTWLNDYMSK